MFDRICMRWFAAILATLSVTYATIARADDVDIYSLPVAAAGRPTVLFIVDNSANWSSNISVAPCDNASANVKATSPNKEEGTKMGIEKCALYKLLASMSTATLSQFNLGFMFFNEPTAGDDSGYPRINFTNVTTDAQRQTLLNFVAGLGINIDKTNKAPMAETFYEAYRWITGGPVYHGNLMSPPKLDVTAFTDASMTTYLSPATSSCTAAHIVYIANGSPQDNDPLSYSLLQKLNPTASNIPIPVAQGVSTPDLNNWADEFAYLFRNQTNISTRDGTHPILVHTIAVTGAPSDGNYPNYMRWVAQQGGGLFQQANDTNTLVSALLAVLNQIKASNSVFASASLPVSANTQGAYLNQVFIGMFRPDANAYERWVGNLKQYQFIYSQVTNNIQLADSLGNPAINPATGFITPSAVSFWTHSSAFWQTIKPDNPSDSPDGDLVERGAVGQTLRESYLSASTNRPVYTCPSAGCTAGTVLSTASANQFTASNAQLVPTAFDPTYTSTQSTLLINWLRGDANVTSTNVANYSAAIDQLGPGYSATQAVNVRAQIHGDVLHTRPVVVNYGLDVSGNNRVVVFYGSNDGMLHAVNGSQTGTGAGSEMWAFVAPEQFSLLKRLRENQPQVLYPSTPPSVTSATPRNYFFDGPIGLYQNTTTGEVFIFVAVRRGGRFLYGFDVTDPNNPKILWKKSYTDLGYASLAQTWSQPKIARVRGITDPVIIMGGGYDNVAEDATPAGTTTMGNQVFVLDLRSGAILATLATDYSVAADISLVDSDGDGYIDRAYAVDMRAQLYRIDIEGSGGTVRPPSSWVITKIGALNDGLGGTSGSRKTFFAPDVVVTRDFTALLFGSGDREKPLLATTNDQFFVVKDTKTSKGEPGAVTLITASSLSTITSGTSTSTVAANGCSLPLQSGEKVINQPVTFGGITYFSTTKPTPASATSCYRGQSTAYELPLICKSPTTQTLNGDGLPPSPVVGYVQINGTLQPFVIGGINSKGSSIEAKKPNIAIPSTRKRTYWYEENKDR